MKGRGGVNSIKSFLTRTRIQAKEEGGDHRKERVKSGGPKTMGIFDADEIGEVGIERGDRRHFREGD